MSPFFQITLQRTGRSKVRAPERISSKYCAKLLIPLFALYLSGCDSTDFVVEKIDANQITEGELTAMEEEIVCDSDGLSAEYFESLERLVQ